MANDFADAFTHYPETPTAEDEARLTCYANLCILGDLLTVQSSRVGRLQDPASDSLLTLVQRWLVPDAFSALVVGEDRLESYRAVLEKIKWSFPAPESGGLFPGFPELSQNRWLPRFIQQVRGCCSWIRWSRSPVVHRRFLNAQGNPVDATGSKPLALEAVPRVPGQSRH